MMTPIIPIINGESKISLRVIDWFVTNYSKKFNTSYFINTEKDTILEEDEETIDDTSHLQCTRKI